MRVFISWSGDRSRRIADRLRGWIPSVLQAVRPYFSPDDIAKGSRWNSEIAKELDASQVGLLALTPENQEAPWLLFEAGALAKNLDRSKVSPILFDGLEPTDVKGPLVQFQATRFQFDDMKRLLKMINGELGDAALNGDVFESVFAMWWPKLEEQVATELAKEAESEDETRRPERDILEEVLALTRALTRERRRELVDPRHPAVDDLMTAAIELTRVLRQRSVDSDTAAALRRLAGPLDYLASRGRLRPSMRRTLLEMGEIQGSAGSQEGSPQSVPEST